MKSTLTKAEQIRKMVETRKRLGSYVAWNKGKPHLAVKGDKHPSWKGGDLEIQCLSCNVIFSARRKGIRTHKFCSKECAIIGTARISYNKGTHMTNSGSFKNGHKQLTGKESPTWRGGIERLPNCLICNKKLSSLTSINCKKHSGKKGIENPKWKGGEATAKIRAIASQHARVTRQKGNGGSYTAQEWLDLIKKFDYMCLCCKRKEPEIKLTADHIIPISMGGTSFIVNIQPLCKSCNCRKHAKHIDYISNFYQIA